jgi:hypothetical protein
VCIDAKPLAACRFETGPGRIREVEQRCASPPTERALEGGGHACGILVIARLRDGALEPCRVERVGFDLEDISARARPQHSHPGLAQLRDVRLQRGGRRGWWRAVPQLVDQPVRRYDAVGVNEEQREQRTWLAAADVDQPVGTDDLERPQDPELHEIPPSDSPGQQSRPPGRAVPGLVLQAISSPGRGRPPTMRT